MKVSSLKTLAVSTVVAVAGLTGALGLPSSAHAAQVTLLNVSYDPTRELYEQYNKAFAAYWQKKTGDNVTVRQSHGGSGQAGPFGHRRSRRRMW